MLAMTAMWAVSMISSLCAVKPPPRLLQSPTERRIITIYCAPLSRKDVKLFCYILPETSVAIVIYNQTSVVMLISGPGTELIL